MATMSKKKASRPDRHQSSHLVRLPEDVYLAMRALAQENDRPLTREIRQALVAWLEAKGKKVPPTAST